MAADAGGPNTNGAAPGTAGQAFASGIYLQGNNSLFFDAQDANGNATTQTAGDVIGDDTGSAAAACYAGAPAYGGKPGYTEGAIGLVKTGAGTLILSAANTYSGGTALKSGTLDLAHATTLNNGAIVSAAAGTSAITLAARADNTAETVKIETVALGADAGHTLANQILNFGQGDTIDLTGIGLARNVTLKSADNTLSVADDGGATLATVKLDTGAAPTGSLRYVATTDGRGGTSVILDEHRTSFTVHNATELNQALARINVGGADPLAAQEQYTITFANGFTLDQQLYAINLGAGDSLAIAGGGFTMDGNGANAAGAQAYSGFFVYNGTVAISDLTIANTVAQGGSGAGGGAGFGGGLFVAGTGNTTAQNGYGNSIPLVTGGNVTLTNVSFSGNKAIGGAGLGGDLRGGGGLNGGTGGNGSSGGGGVGLGANNGFGDGGAGIILGGSPGGSNSAAGGAFGGAGGNNSGGGVGGDGGSAPRNGGFGGGAGQGGQGLGADVFVQAGGTLTVGGTGTLGRASRGAAPPTPTPGPAPESSFMAIKRQALSRAQATSSGWRAPSPTTPRHGMGRARAASWSARAASPAGSWNSPRPIPTRVRRPLRAVR